MRNQIPEEVIENVKQSSDIVDVIGEYVQLKKQGKNYFGLCPFHGENTPSFSVAQEKQIFHCFGCGKGGDVLTFLMELENLSFYESVKLLSERANITLPEIKAHESTSLSAESQQTLEAYEWLVKLYHHLLRYTKDGQDGYHYLINRGLDDEVIDTFQLGYAPNTKDFVVQFLEKKGFQKQLLVKAGIVSQTDDNQVVDRFRGRVIFPIRNHLGKTVGFGARSLNEQGPKYLNSSESELFQKGKLLYNFDLAKRFIRKENEVILFEGYMDVIASFQAGIKHTVATLGTAITENQARLLKRYVHEVIICYDGDLPGQEASYKAAKILMAAGCEVKVAFLENGTDPDSFINKHGGEAFRNQVIRTSSQYMTFFMRYIRKDYNLSLESERLNYIQKVLIELLMIESAVEREYYLQELSSEFSIPIDTLKEEMRLLNQKHGKQDKQNDVRNTKNTNFNRQRKSEQLIPAFQKAERELLYYMLQDAWISEQVQEEIGAGFKVEAHQIIVTYLYAFYEAGHKPDVSRFIEGLADEKLKQLVTEIVFTPMNEEISDEALKDYLRLIKQQSTENTKLQSLKEQLKIAEQETNPKKAAEIASQIMTLHRELRR